MFSFNVNSHAKKWLNAYLDGELPARRARMVSKHLAACLRCRTELEDLKTLQGIVREELHRCSPGAVSEAIWPRVKERIRFASPAGVWLRSRWKRIAVFSQAPLAGAAVAVMLLIAAVGYLVSRNGASRWSLESPAIVEAVEVGPRATALLFVTPRNKLPVVWVIAEKEP